MHCLVFYCFNVLFTVLQWSLQFFCWGHFFQIFLRLIEWLTEADVALHPTSTLVQMSSLWLTLTRRGERQMFLSGAADVTSFSSAEAAGRDEPAWPRRVSVYVSTAKSDEFVVISLLRWVWRHLLVKHLTRRAVAECKQLYKHVSIRNRPVPGHAILDYDVIIIWWVQRIFNTENI